MRWRPYELDPSLPRGRGHDKTDHYSKKFGPEAVSSMIPRMRAVAREHGIEMEYGGHVGNTFDSHRLIWAAREEGGSALQDKVVEELFKVGRWAARGQPQTGAGRIFSRCCALTGVLRAERVTRRTGRVGTVRRRRRDGRRGRTPRRRREGGGRGPSRGPSVRPGVRLQGRSDVRDRWKVRVERRPGAGCVPPGVRQALIVEGGGGDVENKSGSDE